MKKHYRNIFLPCFLICLILVLIMCKPKSKAPFTPYVPEEEDPQTMMCVDMESYRLSIGD